MLCASPAKAVTRTTCIADVSASASGGTGAIGSPWTGWETAVNACGTYKTITFPAGYYSASTAIAVKDGWLVAGVGDTSIIKVANSANTTLFVSTNEAYPVSDVIIRQLQLDGNKANQSGQRHLIALRAARNTVYSNLTMINPAGDCITHSRDTGGRNPQDWTIKTISCDGFKRNGISVVESERWVIDGATLTNADAAASPGSGIDVEATDTASVISHGRMRNITSTGNKYGIQLFGGVYTREKNSLTGCTLSNNDTYGLWVYYFDKITISGCTLTNNDAFFEGTSIDLSSVVMK
jgi:parallel beta-helix repeat protein